MQRQLIGRNDSKKEIKKWFMQAQHKMINIYTHFPNLSGLKLWQMSKNCVAFSLFNYIEQDSKIIFQCGYLTQEPRLYV